MRLEGQGQSRGSGCGGCEDGGGSLVMVGVRLGERTRPHIFHNHLPQTSLNISPKIFVINVFYIYLNTEEIISSLYICTKMFVHYSIFKLNL